MSATKKTEKRRDLTALLQAEEIKLLAKGATKSKKSLNDIVTIFETAERTSKEETILACIRAYHRIFCHYLSADEVQIHPGEELHEDSSQVQIRRWLRERYYQSVSQLLEWSSHPASVVQELAVCTLMKYVEAEGKKPVDPAEVKKSKASSPVLEKVIDALLLSTEDRHPLIIRFQEYLESDDLRYYYMNYVLQLVTTSLQVEEELTAEKECKLNNILSGLMTLSLPSDDTKLSNFFFPQRGAGVQTSIKCHRALFSKLWMAFINLKLTRPIYRRILISLPDKVIPYLQDPLVLSDWLITLYNHGGAVSLMALNGLYVLINSHNLDYPDFYNKLYNIMNSEIFQAKYKARFFHLLDQFMTSMLLPTYTVAAFIKKLSRMALTAPPEGILLIIELIINLLIRHNTCQLLVHRDQPCSLETDPYDPLATDIKKCRAMDSSLWEIKTLQKHWFHRIASQAKRVEQALPKVGRTLDDLLETDSDQLIATEMKTYAKFKGQQEKKGLSSEGEVAMNSTRPQGILQWETSALRDLWCVEAVTTANDTDDD